MNILVLRHVLFEGPAKISDWAHERGYPLRIGDVNIETEWPELGSFDMLIIMGGPMSVNDEARLPWLKTEKQFIGTAIKAHKAVLGICLGAQLIASYHGSTIYPAIKKEMGWFPVSRISLDSNTAFDLFPEGFMPFHWHGETFDLPEKSIRLLETASCPNQAFQIGDRVIGLQFHLEVTPESVEQLIESSSSEIEADGKFQQSVDVILKAKENYQPLYPILYGLLDYLAGQIALHY